jgi:hypothetical protein
VHCTSLMCSRGGWPQVLQQMEQAGTRQLVEDVSIEHMIAGIDNKGAGVAPVYQRLSLHARFNVLGLLRTSWQGLCCRRVVPTSSVTLLQPVVRADHSRCRAFIDSKHVSGSTTAISQACTSSW